jgi:hypothetical protein
MSAARPRPLLLAALAVADRGWPVFPLIPGGKRPSIVGWPDQATVDAGVLAVWWRERPYNPLTGLTRDSPPWTATGLLLAGRTSSSAAEEVWWELLVGWIGARSG